VDTSLGPRTIGRRPRMCAAGCCRAPGTCTPNVTLSRPTAAWQARLHDACKRPHGTGHCHKCLTRPQHCQAACIGRYAHTLRLSAPHSCPGPPSCGGKSETEVSRTWAASGPHAPCRASSRTPPSPASTPNCARTRPARNQAAVTCAGACIAEEPAHEWHLLLAVLRIRAAGGGLR